MSRLIQREIARVPHFSLGNVLSVDTLSGKLEIKTGARSQSRTQIGTVLSQPLTPGSTALMLSGGEQDQTAALGYAPFMA